MKKTIIDKNILEAIRLVHNDLQRLNEQDVVSIFDLLKSDDPEIQIMGIMTLDSFNYFETPETVYYLYNNSDITNEIDEDDIFADMIRCLYGDSDRFYKEASEEIKEYDKNLIVTLCKNL